MNKESGFAIPVILVAVLIILVAALYFLIWSKNKTESPSPKAQGQGQRLNFKSAKDLILSGDIKGPEKIIEVSLNFDKSSPSSLRISQARVLNGYVPQGGLNRGYSLQVLDEFNELLDQQLFEIPDTFHSDPKPGEVLTSVNWVSLDKVNFTINLAYGSSSKKLRIVDQTGKIIQGISLENIKIIENEPDYYSLPREKSFSELFMKKTYASGRERIVDLAFVGYKFGSREEFTRLVESYFNTLLTFEPFKSKRVKIRPHIVYISPAENMDLGCKNGQAEFNISRLYYCDNEKVAKLVNGRAVPFDFIAMMINESEYGGAGYVDQPFSYTTKGAGPAVFIHELGHSMGLLDEYVVSSENPPRYTDERDNSFFKNCFTGKSPFGTNAIWNGQSSYFEGCGDHNNWVRSSETSIMKDTSAEFFNDVSIRILQGKISQITGEFPNPAPNQYDPRCGYTINLETGIQTPVPCFQLGGN